MLNAFCRVAPSVRFSLSAIRDARFFWRAIVLSMRTCSAVHARRFFTFFAIQQLPVSKKKVLAGNNTEQKPKSDVGACAVERSFCLGSVRYATEEQDEVAVRLRNPLTAVKILEVRPFHVRQAVGSSFIIGKHLDDTAYEKDLGPDTEEIAEKITSFDPTRVGKRPR